MYEDPNPDIPNAKISDFDTARSFIDNRDTDYETIFKSLERPEMKKTEKKKHISAFQVTFIFFVFFFSFVFVFNFGLISFVFPFLFFSREL
jgi:hypothetical protein